MNPKNEDFISLIKLYCRVIYHNAHFLFAFRPILRLLALTQHHRSRFIGKTKFIGDNDFINDCEEFSRRLQKEDAVMYENIFAKGKFIFIQYSDAFVANFMFGEFSVPTRYQKLKASGVGALMVYAFYCTELVGRTIGSAVRFRKSGRYSTAKEKTYTWLMEHKYPEVILEWYRRDLQKTSDLKT